MGTALIDQKINLLLPLWSAKCNLTHPKTVLKIHQDNISAGAEYITTNTFRTTPRAYEKAGFSKSESNSNAYSSLMAAANLAKQAAVNHAKVIGSIAPLEDCYSPELFPGKESATNEFRQIVGWMNKTEIDILLFETMNNIAEIEAGLIAGKNANCPVWVSLYLKDELRLASGETLKSCIDVIKKFNVECLLLNCNSLTITNKALSTCKKLWNRNWGIYPNLGIGEPAVDGKIEQFSSDKEFLETINTAIGLGASVVGGCCGTKAYHTKLLKKLTAN